MTPASDSRKREYDREWRARNRDKVNAYQREYRAKNRDTLTEKQKARYFSNKEYAESRKTPCVICGESRNPCIDFHHREPSDKLYHPADAYKLSRKLLSAELDKCICLCSNCHRLYHAGDESVVSAVDDG